MLNQDGGFYMNGNDRQTGYCYCRKQIRWGVLARGAHEALQRSWIFG